MGPPPPHPTHPRMHPSAFEPHAVRSWVRHSGGPAPRHPLPHAARKLRFCVAATALSRRFYPLNRGIERCYRSFHKQCAKTCASVCCRCGHVPRSVCLCYRLGCPAKMSYPLIFTLSHSPVIRNRSLCLPHLSPTLVVRYCTPAEASPLPPSLSPSPFHLMAQGSPELDWLLLFVSPIFVAHHHGPHGLVLRLSCPCLCQCSKFCIAAATSVDCVAASAATMLLLSPLPCLAVLQLCVCRRNAASLLNSHTTQHSTFLSAKKRSITSARGLHEKNLRRNA